MDKVSFADKLKMFNAKPPMGGRIAKVHGNNNGPSADSSLPEKVEQSGSNTSNQSFDDTNPTISNTIASSNNTKLAHILLQGANNYPSLKRSPAHLSKSFNSNNIETIHSESSNVFQDTTPSPIGSSNTNSHIGLKKKPIPLPKPFHKDRADIVHSESSNISQDNTVSSVDLASATSHTDFKKKPIPLPKPFNKDRTDIVHSEAPTISGDNTASPVLSSNTTSHADIKKQPAPLPNQVSRDQDEDISLESLAVSHDTILYRAYPSEANATSNGLEKPPVPLTVSIDSNRKQSQDSSSSYILQDEISSPVVSSSPNIFTNINKPPAPLPKSVNIDRHENTHFESLSVSLDAMLSSKSMFWECENTINDYKRRDPRAIIYPKLKVTMPTITTNEIDILQRYLNK